MTTSPDLERRLYAARVELDGIAADARLHREVLTAELARDRTAIVEAAHTHQRAAADLLRALRRRHVAAEPRSSLPPGTRLVQFSRSDPDGPPYSGGRAVEVRDLAPAVDGVERAPDWRRLYEGGLVSRPSGMLPRIDPR